MSPRWSKCTLPASQRMSVAPGSSGRSAADSREPKSTVQCRSRCARSVPSISFSTRPARSTSTRSAASSTSDKMCEDISALPPAARCPASRSKKRSFMIGSSPSVGSSMITSSGSCWNAWTMAIFCRMPRE